MAWRAVARSSTGTNHQKHQMPCQDYGEYKIFDNLIVGAVADGAGSAKYADVGAKLAVQTVLKYFTRIEQWLHKRQCCQLIYQPFSEEQARKLFRKTLQKVVTALQKQAENKGYSVNDFACTLLVMIATPAWVVAMQIGDGFIVVRFEKEDLKLLFQPNKGEYINQTTFVTSTNAFDVMQISVQSGYPEFICAATDGLERLAIQMSDWTPFIPFFQPLEEYLRNTSYPEQEDERLLSFLNSNKLNARTDDDKTLLLCLCDLGYNQRGSSRLRLEPL